MTTDGLLPEDWKLTLGAVVSAEQGYLGFTTIQPEKYPYKDDFVETFNSILMQLKEKGEIEVIVKAYLEKDL